MGFWTSGPVVGSLIVFVVGSATIAAILPPGLLDARVQDRRDRRVGGLRDRSDLAARAVTGARDQLMVTIHDRALIEAKAKGIDIVASLRHPFRPAAQSRRDHLRVGIAMFLLFYSTAVGFALIYFTTVFGFSVTTPTRWATGCGGSMSSR